jgi:type VI secretion system VasD/TssJ family lipoprotein
LRRARARNAKSVDFIGEVRYKSGHPMFRFSLAFGVLLAVSAFAGCAHNAPPPPAAACKEPDLKVTVRGSDRLNMDEAGRSLAVVVRIYQLKTLKTLEDADFDQVWQHDRETLGEDLVSVDEVTVDPADKKSVPVKRNMDARYLVAVGLFRKPDGIAWRATRSLGPICGGEGAVKAPPPVYIVSFVAEDYRIEGGS